MHGLITRVDRLMTNADGATVLEYAFIASIISIAAVGLWVKIGSWVAGVFSTLAGAF
jgi:Flp pilus assembly pilin Flp